MNTIIINESDLNFEKYNGCSSPFMLENFKLIIHTKENTEEKFQIRTVDDGMIYKWDNGPWVGVNANLSIEEMFPTKGQMAIAINKKSGDVSIGEILIPLGYNSDEDNEFIMKNAMTFYGYKAYKEMAQRLCSIMCCLMMMGKEERIRKQVKAIPSEHNGSQAKSENSRKQTVYLMKDIISYIADNYTGDKAHTMSCPCWEVRGHYRHYKSGKTVFISSFKKGKSRNTMEPNSKEYIL